MHTLMHALSQVSLMASQSQDTLSAAVQRQSVNAALSKGEKMDRAILHAIIANEHTAKELMARHDPDLAAAEALAKVFHIYRNLCEREDNKLVGEELQHLARASEVEHMLIKAEADRRRQGVSQIRSAYNIRSSLASTRSHTLSESERRTLAEARSVEVEQATLAELHRLAAAYRVHDNLSAREDKRLENEELEHLVRAAEVEKAITEREEDILATAQAVLAGASTEY